jgi:MFS family permease
MPVLFVLMLLMGVVFGTNNLTTVAFAESIGRPELTGLLLAVFPAAALLGGAVLSAVPRRWSLTAQIRLALMTLTLALVPLPFVASAGVFAVAAFLIGLSVPAIIAGSFALVAAVVPRARLTEALALSGAGITIGIATASTLAGALIDAHGPAWAFPVSGISAALALLWFTTRARVMSAAERAAEERTPAGAPRQAPADAGDLAERAALAQP